MDTKPTAVSHIETKSVKEDNTPIEGPNLALGLLLHNEEREKSVLASAWYHRRILVMCKPPALALIQAT